MGWLSDINAFHKWEDKDIWKRMKDNPEQLLLGFGDPIQARVAKGITGKDYESFSDLGLGNRDFKNYEAETGHDPKSVEKVRTTVGSIFAIAYGAYGADSLGWGSLAGKGLGALGSSAVKGASGDFATTGGSAGTGSSGSEGMGFFSSLLGGAGSFGGPLGGLLGNLFTGGGTSNAQTAAGMNDPFAGQRGQYQSQLSALMADPSLVKNQPGYQSQYDEAFQGMQRQMAAAGNTNSTLAMDTAAKFGPQFEQMYLDKEMDRLMVLSGATLQPQHPGDTYQRGMAGSQSALSNLFGQGLGQLFGGQSGGFGSMLSGLFGGGGSMGQGDLASWGTSGGMFSGGGGWGGMGDWGTELGGMFSGGGGWGDVVSGMSGAM